MKYLIRWKHDTRSSYCTVNGDNIDEILARLFTVPKKQDEEYNRIRLEFLANVGEIRVYKRLKELMKDDITFLEYKRPDYVRVSSHVLLKPSKNLF